MKKSRLARWVILAGVVTLLGGIAWAFWLTRSTDLPPELLSLQTQMRTLRDSRASLTPQQRDALWASVRKQMESLPPEQREQLFAGRREEFRKRMEERLDAYFAASPAERVAMLDRQIAQMEARRRDLGSGRPGRGTGRGGLMGGTREERNERRRQRLDATTPEFRAKAAEYVKAMRKRRAELGLPDAPGGRRGF